MRLSPGEHLMNPLLHNRLNVALLTIALIGLMSGLGLMVTDKPHLATIAWAAGVFPVLAARLIGALLPQCSIAVRLPMPGKAVYH